MRRRLPPPQAGMFDGLVAAGELGAPDVDRLATMIAAGNAERLYGL